MKPSKADNFHAHERPQPYNEPYFKQREFILTHRYGKPIGIVMILIYLALAIVMINQ